MIPQNIKHQIISIWDKYIADNKKVLDTKGNEYDDIDGKRIEAISKLKPIINTFISGNTDLLEFRANIDSFNKQNNYWGFTSIKGQMFFNLLLKTCESEEQISKITKILRNSISEPKDLNDALSKIEALEKYSLNLFNKATDKRKAPNPASICYFLSYFWQIFNHENWAVMYNSIIVSLTDLGIWEVQKTEKEAYLKFYTIYEEIKQLLSDHSGKQVSNWEAEHAFWNLKPVNKSTNKPPTPKGTKQSNLTESNVENIVNSLIGASFDIYDYIPPITAKLSELGKEDELSGVGKGVKFEKTVVEAFRQLGFTEVIHLGQGRGNEPDLIVKYRIDSTAFIIDAKSYSNGYNLSTADDRAIRDYISRYCAILYNEGIRKIAFIIVSNSFKSRLDDYIQEITWSMDIKRFKLLTSDALLHLLAYKFKGVITLPEIVEALTGFGNIIYKEDIIQKFDDI